MDGLAKDTCGDYHRVVEAHGGIAAEYGSEAGAEWARAAQEYGLEIAGHGLHPIGPEQLDDVELRHKLQVMKACDPAFVLIAGYSFGLFNGRCDDQLALASFIGRFRDVSIDVYVCAPEPVELAGLLSDRLRSNRVRAVPIYWNVLAWAFTQVVAGRMDAAHLDHFHNATLDAFGPSFMPDLL